MLTAERKKVKLRVIGWDAQGFGPVYLARITYADGRVTWGVNFPGGSMRFGHDRSWMNQTIRAMVADPKCRLQLA
jgi:hypothetical protein